MTGRKFTYRLGNRDLVIETGRLSRQADGAVVVQYGETIILATVVMGEELKEPADFIPLSVDYQERVYSVGKIPGGFFKREGRPRDKEIITARLIDRAIRPLLPQEINFPLQILVTVICSDQENLPDILGVIGASAALQLSPIPFNGPVSALRIGDINQKLVLNPFFSEIGKSELNLVVAATAQDVIMVEMMGQGVREERVLEAIEEALPHLREINQLQEKLRAELGKEKVSLPKHLLEPKLSEEIKNFAIEKIREANLIPEKKERQLKIDKMVSEAVERFAPEGEEGKGALIKKFLQEIERAEVRAFILREKRRVDKRSFSEIRPISCEVGLLPRTHGSCLFTRGQTQALVVTTLGTTEDEQKIEDLEEDTTKPFMLHYNFPPFSVGEISPLRAPARREIGHGNLAERALKSVIPPSERFPYTIRVVSDILESNGSSSMATVCGASLSLMDAGVPIKEPIAGVGMGLLKEGNEVVILSDITGLEDRVGDMDFKVAGGEKGLTALQLDLKTLGIPLSIMKKALDQAKEARKFILEKMKGVLDKPRTTLSSYAPSVIRITIPPSKIKDVIGPAGRTIKKITDETNATIEIKDDGQVYIFAQDKALAERAKQLVEYFAEEVKVGEVYLGKVTRVTTFGVFVEILPGKEGLVHISQLADYRVRSPEDIAKEGDEILVKVIGIDEQERIQLSRREALAERRETR
jgi:polyribonucleotide nucleotidyltransferase